VLPKRRETACAAEQQPLSFGWRTRRGWRSGRPFGLYQREAAIAHGQRLDMPTFAAEACGEERMQRQQCWRALAGEAESLSTPLNRLGERPCVKQPLRSGKKKWVFSAPCGRKRGAVHMFLI